MRIRVCPVTFTVTDSSGATASQTRYTICGQNN
jgi:hypothetical protein